MDAKEKKSQPKKDSQRKLSRGVSKLSSDSQEKLTDTLDEDRMVEVTVEYETSSGANTDAFDPKAPRSISILTLMDQSSNKNEKPSSKKKIKLAAPSGRRYIEKHVVVDQPSTKVDGQLSGKKPVRKVVDTYNKKLDIVTSKGRATKSLFASSTALAHVKESEVADSAARPINELEMNANAVDVPVIMDLESIGRNIDSEHPRPITGEALLDFIRDGRNNSNVYDGHKNSGHEKQKGRRSSQKRKRGKPTRFVVEMPKSVKAGIERSGTATLSSYFPSVEKLRALYYSLTKLLCVVIVGKGGSGVGDDKSVILKNHSDGVEPLTETEQESADARKSLAEKLKNDVGITGALTCEADDDQPLSLWFVHPCSTSGEASRFSSGPLANGGSETTANQVAAAVDCHAISIKQNQAEDADRCPPFQKKSRIWKTIESMEVFQLMPQNPHFLPLVKCKDEYREGSAIGFMVTFASLFDKVSSLRFDDPRSIFVSILESLVDLEKHGFDISILQDRLNDLLLIKEREGGLLNESLDTEKLIAEQARERKVLAEKMEGIRKAMAKLQEEYAASDSKMLSMDLEISKLQKEVDSARVRISDARHNFEQLVNAPWRLS